MVVSTFKHEAVVCISSEATEDFKSLDPSEKERALISLLYHEFTHMKGIKDEALALKFQEFVFSHLSSFNKLKILLADLDLLKDYVRDTNSFYDNYSLINTDGKNVESLLSIYLDFPFLATEEIVALESFYDGADYFIDKRNGKGQSKTSALLPKITRSQTLVNNRITILRDIIKSSELEIVTEVSTEKANFLNQNYNEIRLITKELDDEIDLILRGYDG